MLTSSHIIVANKVLNGGLGKQVSKRIRYAFAFGSIAPDFFFFITPHRYISSLDKVESKLNKLGKYKDCSMLRAYRLGLTLHYICDYFCRPHNDVKIMTGLQHIIYEQKLSKLVKDEIETIKIFDSVKSGEFLSNLRSLHSKYESGITTSTKSSLERDLKYIVSIAEGLVKSYSSCLLPA